MKLTNTQCLNIDAALRALDGTHEKIIEDGKVKKIANVKFDFSKGFRFANGMRRHLLDPVIKLIQKEQQELLYEYGEPNEDGGFSVPGKNFVAYSRKMTELLETTVEVDLELINDDEFKADENKAVGSDILKELVPIRAGLVDERKPKPELVEAA